MRNRLVIKTAIFVIITFIWTNYFAQDNVIKSDTLKKNNRPEEPAVNKINFAGIKWVVRSGIGGPGPNTWSNSTKSIWVDEKDNLHLKIRKIGEQWNCTEIYTDDILGYGEYTFYLSSNVEKYDPNIVVGLFNYENDTKEIDIEFSRWGNIINNEGWYVVQPSNEDSKLSYPLNLTGVFSTHKVIWTKNGITFQSYNGHYEKLPSPNYLIREWDYTGANNPEPNEFRFHINFWLMNGLPPKDMNEAELIISDFKYKPIQ